MTFHILTWTIAAFSIIGVVLNIKKLRACFYVWACTNALWMWIDFSKGIYAQVALFFVYFCLAVWGIFAWRKKDAQAEEIKQLREEVYAYLQKVKSTLAELGYPCMIGEPIENKIREIVEILRDYEAAAMESSEW